jgi:hypothetical protein
MALIVFSYPDTEPSRGAPYGRSPALIIMPAGLGRERRETADAAKRTRKSAKDHGAGVEHMRSIAIAIFPGVQALDVAGPLDVFAETNGLLSSGRRYDIIWNCECGSLFSCVEILDPTSRCCRLF